MASLAIERSSVLPRAEVIGVPLVEPASELESRGVELAVSVVPSPFALADALDIFSARRFCLDAEGGMMGVMGTDSSEE